MSTCKDNSRYFYVFYNKWDYVRCCGTAKDLVARGFFKNTRNVKQSAQKLNKYRPNSVVKIPMPKCAARSVLNVHRT